MAGCVIEYSSSRFGSYETGLMWLSAYAVWHKYTRTVTSSQQHTHTHTIVAADEGESTENEIKFSA